MQGTSSVGPVSSWVDPADLVSASLVGRLASAQVDPASCVVVEESIAPVPWPVAARMSYHFPW